MTADRHGFFKYMASALAEKHGMRATFMPKPFINLSGNGKSHALLAPGLHSFQSASKNRV